MRSHFRPLAPRAGVATAFASALGLGLGLFATGCGPAETSATASLTWQIVDAKEPNANTAPALNCEAKKVAFIRLQASPGGGTFDFACSSMAAETTTVNAGIYSIQAIALTANYQAVAQLTFQQRLFGRTALGHIIFQVP